MSYDDKITAKKEHYTKMAQKCEQESTQQYNQTRELLDCVWGGQPILVGHHSEKRHRKLLENVDNKMRKSIALQDKADYYQRKAEVVGTAGISSLDENAIDKLKLKLEELIKVHEEMKLYNKIAKKEGTPPLEWYRLSYSNAEIKRVKKRIEELEINQQYEGQVVEYAWFTYKQEDGRILLMFDDKPTEEMRKIIKQYGFKWSPTRSAWTRICTANALYSVKYLVNKLKNNEVSAG